MSEKELEIFELCERLRELLGDKEAIADLKALWKRHPEMFKDMQEVANTIQKVVSEPEIIVDANKDNRNYEVIKVAKILNTEKMADVVIKNEKGTNEIFHANKKRIGEFERLKNKENLLQVETPTPSTHQLNGLELIDENLSSANALSTIDNNIIPQSKTPLESKTQEDNYENLESKLQAKQEAKRGREMQENTKNLTQDSKIEKNAKSKRDSAQSADSFKKAKPKRKHK
ncbi:hypothetical protein [Helicobacter turcicus]|uniref:hypothetical protein n=1 Tax=Helicobacter turcicus TaxID=2867412 RepID=UPI001F45DFD3|nr:hypothetical protein [Helicobacter turcicus]